MADWKLRLYHHLPPLLRNGVATLRGYQLRHWRYGADSEQLIEAALERDTWSQEQWKSYQDNRLAYLLHRAATQVPYYRAQWAERRRNGDRASWDYLENWGILEKEALRQQPTAFVADDTPLKSMFHTHTSGTTGTPIHIYWTRENLRQWYALFEARWRRWYGLSRHHCWGILGGQLVAPVAQQQPPFWAWNVAMNQLYLSSYHITPGNVPLYVDAMRRYGIDHLICYSSAGYALAEEMRHSGISAPPLRAILTNAEPLYAYQRAAIAEAFNCPVYETYGLSEAVIGAGECEYGALHLWQDAGIGEIVDGDRAVSEGESGEMIATGLINEAMPFIRYRVGDRAALHAGEQPCACGRTLRRLAGVDGRSDDMLYTVDGHRIGRLDPVFKANLPIREAQIVQDALDSITVRVVPAEGYSAVAEASIAERLRERLGDVQVRFEQLNEIPRTSNGKFRAVICNLSPQDLERVRPS